MVRATLLVGLGALVLAASALGANGGLVPVKPASENAEAIRQAYWLILAVTTVVFVLVETTLIVFLVRYRRGKRPRDAEGPQVRGHRNIEIAWTLVPVVLLAGIVAFVFAKLPSIENTPPAVAGNGLTIGVEGHQYYWLFRYPGGAVSIDHMVVPVGAVVTLDVTSPDVIHSWWIPSLGGKIDAIPGRLNHTWFKAEHTGVFTGRCAELCGSLHALMLASVEAVSPGAFEKFLGTHRQGSETVGKETFDGVCAKCHGFQGEGTDEGPKIAGRTFDTVTAQLIHDGGTRMPAVGATWSAAQVKATIDYLNKAIGVQSGG